MTRPKRIALALAVLLAFAFVALVLRGPQVEDYLMKRTFSELDSATGLRFSAEEMHVNIFPLFVEADELRAFDEKGSEVFGAEKVKAYVGLSGVLKKTLSLSRVFVARPSVSIDRERADSLRDSLSGYSGDGGKGAFKLKIKMVEIRDGGLNYRDEGKETVVEAKGMDAKVLFKKEPEIDFGLKELSFSKGGWPEFRGSAKGRATVGKERLNISSLTLDFLGSSAGVSGFFEPGQKKGAFRAAVSLLVGSVRKVFSLRGPEDGFIKADGDVNFEGDLSDPSLDLKTRGEFRLETLMELFDVRERVEGPVAFEGKIRGRPSNLEAEGRANLKGGNLFGIDVTEARGDVLLKDGILSFKEIMGRLYGGEAEARAALSLPHVGHYSVDVEFRDVDSASAAEVIGLKIDLPKGKVKGHMSTSGGHFEPEGWYDYKAVTEYAGAMGRIKLLSGRFDMKGDILRVYENKASTGKSSALWECLIDLESDKISAEASLKTEDMADLTAPYFDGLKGAGEFKASVSGTTSKPVVNASLRTSDTFFDGLEIGVLKGEVSYKDNLLTVKGIEGDSVSLRGAIGFPGSKGIFDFGEPSYDISLMVKKAAMEDVLGLFAVDDFSLKGTLEADLKLRGRGRSPALHGLVSVSEPSVYGVGFDSASLRLSFEGGRLGVGGAELKKDGRTIELEGWSTTEGDFSFHASTGGVLLGDLIPRDMPFDYALSFKAEGKGTFKEPEISLEGVLSDGLFMNSRLGGGTLKASLRGRDVRFEFGLLDGRASVDGHALLKGDVPWSADIDMGHGRYDFLLGGIFKEMPEDMLLNIMGQAAMRGDKDEFEATVRLSRLNVALYGQSFGSDSDVVFSVKDKTVKIESLSLKSGRTSFSLRGSVAPGRYYDIVLDGASSLSPLKAFFENIEVIKGDTNYVFSISGPWENPAINGGISVTEAAVALKSIPQRISSISAYIYVDRDMLVVEEFSGRLGGGDLELKGVAFIRGFEMDRFYLDAVLSDVTLYLMKDLLVNFGGNLIYKGTPESQELVGELMTNRAKYTGRIEWKSWLLKARQAEAPKAAGGAMGRTKLNVRLRGTDNIIVDNNMARAPIAVDLNLKGTASAPIIMGRVEARKGKIYFRNNEFEILRATADFADPSRINPFIDVMAETSVKGYAIRLGLEGQLDRFSLILTSDPQLEEVEILALLTSGQFGEGLKGLEGGIGAAEATAFVTGQLQDVLEERLRDITGLDRFQIDPYVSKSTGAVTPRITVSKKLMGERLFVTYSTAVGTAEEQVLKMEYVLKRNVSLVGVRDERGSLGGDIKFRFEFR